MVLDCEVEEQRGEKPDDSSHELVPHGVGLGKAEDQSGGAADNGKEPAGAERSCSAVAVGNMSEEKLDGAGLRAEAVAEERNNGRSAEEEARGKRDSDRTGEIGEMI